MKYPVYIPHISSKAKEYVNDCLDTGWISSLGKYVEIFEQKVCDYTGAPYAVAVSNGTVALHLALLVADVEKNDEVIVPDFTYIATANAVLYVGAKPVFCDVSRDSWNITLTDIKQFVTPKTKAVIVTDIYGTTPEMDEIISYCNANNITLISDSAESIGGAYKGKKTGNIANITTFSFFGNKTITTGEGGMVLTKDKTIYNRLRQLRNQGNSPKIRYYHEVLGYNYRMTNIQAAIGTAQMERIHDIIQRKNEIHNRYEQNLVEYFTFQKFPDHIYSSRWMVSMLAKTNRDELAMHLTGCGIETRPFFKPASSMPYLASCSHANTVFLSDHGINLPSFPTLKNDDVDYISEKIILFAKNSN